MINSLSDISLVTQVVVLHNKSAFDQLVRKYQSQVRRFFLNQTCGDKELSDDLAQDTFIKAYTNLKSFVNYLKSYLFKLSPKVYNYFEIIEHFKNDNNNKFIDKLYTTKNICESNI